MANAEYTLPTEKPADVAGQLYGRMRFAAYCAAHGWTDNAKEEYHAAAGIARRLAEMLDQMNGTEVDRVQG